MKKTLSRCLLILVFTLFCSSLLTPATYGASLPVEVPRQSTLFELSNQQGQENDHHRIFSSQGATIKTTPDSQSSSLIHMDAPSPRKTDYMNEQAETVYYWYLWVRTYVAVPVLIVTFAWCGLSILSSAVTGNSQSINKAKERAFYAVLAFGVLMALPVLIRYTRSVVESSAWKP